MIGFVVMFVMPIVAPPRPTPIDFVIGHCWVGKPKPSQTDRHCFTRGRDGVTIRDQHSVTEGGKVLMSGDTVYRWVGGVFRYTYRDSRGGTVSSIVTKLGNIVDFGTADYRTKDGKSYAIHARWIVLGPTGYQSELSSPAIPLLKRVTTYSRVS